MLLLDSLYVNTGGAMVLLDYLVEELHKSEIDVFYLFDKRCQNSFGSIPGDRKQFLKASLINRSIFYAQHGKQFSSIFCFGNLPPFIKQRVPTITYFHQKLYIGSLETSASLKKGLLLYLKRTILRMIKHHSDTWLVQQDAIKVGLNDTYGISKTQIEVLPFYPPIEPDGNTYERQKDSFLYVSSGSSHKNQELLIDAFCRFFDRYKKGKLTLTIDHPFSSLLELIKIKVEKGYPICNVGFLAHNKMYALYNSHEYLVFPSKAESFGLGIVEAIENGCKVIGADLPYMHAICEPSLTFDPDSREELIDCFHKATIGNLPDSKSKVKNEIDRMIELLANQTGKTETQRH